MTHVYCGDGKGKTTCAMGLALRCAGRGGRVTVAQFLKNSDSGERYALKNMENVTLLPAAEVTKFVFQMTDEEKRELAEKMVALFEQAAGMVRRGECDMLVLDELCSAITTGMVSLDAVISFLDEKHTAEIVITGRDPARALIDRADYVTEMRKVKHPYEEGTPARKGVEW